MVARLPGLGGEGICLAIHLLGSDGVREQDNAIAERRCLVLLQGEVQCGQLGIEDAGAERIDSEQAIAARVPGSGIAGVAGVVEEADGDGMASGRAGESAPASAGPPGGVALDSLAGEIDAGGGGVISCIDLGGVAARVHEDAAFFIGRFEPVGDAQAEQAILCILEDNAVEGLESDGHIDDASLSVAREDVARGLRENLLVISSYPDRFDG